MKTILVYLLTVGCLAPLFGQSKFALSVQVAPVYKYGDSKVTLPIADLATQLPTTELVTTGSGFTYSLGIMGRYSFLPKWSVSTGVWATHSVWSKTNYTQNGIPYSIRYGFNHPFTNFYKVPLLLNYQPSSKRLSPYFSAGVTFDFRGTSYVDLDGNGELVAVKFGKPVVVTPLLGAGVSYRLTNHTVLIAQPAIQYDLESRPSYTYYHAYQLSLQAQLMHQF